MQPNSGGLNPDNDYLHFCMNSAAINIYLDMYWTEVFSTHVVNEAAVLHRQKFGGNIGIECKAKRFPFGNVICINCDK